jgi:hypothetical protein
MTEGYFTMGNLMVAISEYNIHRSSKKFHVKLNQTEKNELLKKINVVKRKLEVQKITPEKVRKEGTFTDKFTTGIRCRLPMDFIKENYVYYPTFFDDSVLLVGIEIIIPMEAVCYLQTTPNGRAELWIAEMGENGWSAYVKADGGIYILGLNRFRFLNWDKNPWGDVK